MAAIDIALLVLRAWVGTVMIAHGINHGRNLEGTASWFGKVGFKAPGLNALLSTILEVAIGVALILGVLTPVAAAGVVAIMAVAFWAIHRFAGFFVFYRPDEGYEYVTTLAMVALALSLAGPGAFSVDAALGFDQLLDGWVGGAIYSAGIFIAIAQLALLWRRPPS